MQMKTMSKTIANDQYWLNSHQNNPNIMTQKQSLALT